MSRRRGDKNNIDREDVVVDVLCHKGHRVGFVRKHVGFHPRAGTYTTNRGVRFEDVPDPDALSGRVRGVCAAEDAETGRLCGDDVQILWSRIKRLLDTNEELVRHTDEIRP